MQEHELGDKAWIGLLVIAVSALVVAGAVTLVAGAVLGWVA